jgi:hypothetical protein
MELTEAMFKEFEGAEGLAREMYQTYREAPAGSATRERVLQSVVNLVLANQKLGLHEDIDPSMLTDEELANVEQQLNATD